MMTKAIVRGCGRRKHGAIYLEVEIDKSLAPWEGHPIECFVKCPAVQIDPSRLGLAPQGMRLYQRDETDYLFDWVGASHYPDVAGFLEEAARFGVSRRIPANFNFAALTRRTRLVLVHSRACLAGPYARSLLQHDPNLHVEAIRWQPRGTECIHILRQNRCMLCRDKPLKTLHGYADPNGDSSFDVDPSVLCTRLWWQDVTQGVPATPEEVEGWPSAHKARAVVVHAPSFTYRTFGQPDNTAPSYRPGIFAAFPISKIAVIRDPHQGTHEKALESARHAELPVELEEM